MAGVWDHYLSPTPETENNDNPWLEYAGKKYTPPKPRTRNSLAVANDTVITGVNAGLGLGKSISDFVSVDNPVSRGLQSIIDEGEQNYSDIVKQNRAELNQAMDAGGMEAVKGVGKYIVQNPLQTAAEVIGNVGPFGRAVSLGVKGAQLAGLGAKGATYVGRGVGGALGAAAGGGDAASNAYELVMNSPNIPDDQKEVLARKAAREASALPALIGGAFGATGLTGNIISKAGGKAARHGILRTGATEFGQEFGEEGLTQLSANLAARQYDPSIDPMQGVVGAATYGGFLGGFGGAGHALLNRPSVPSNLLNPDQTSADDQNKPLLGLNPNVPLQSWINQQTGVTKPLNQNALKSRQADIMAAMNEPSGQFVSDENGIERELTMGELATRGYAPPEQTSAAPATTTEISDEVQKAADIAGISLKNKKGTVVEQRVQNLTRALKLLGDGVLTQTQFDETVEQLKKSRYGAIKKTLDQVEADAAAKADQAAKLAEAKQPRRVQKEANVSLPTTPTEAINPSVPTGSPDTAGGVAVAGSNAVVGGRNNSNAVLPNSNSGEVSLLSSEPSQPVTPVVRRKRVVNVAALQPAQAYTAAPTVEDNVVPQAAAPEELSPEDQVAIAQATGNDTDVKAQQEEDLGQRQEVTEKDRQDTIDSIFRKRFETSKDPQRDIQIAKAYLAAQLNAPHKSKSAIKADIAAQFGIGLSSIEKIGNPEALIRAGQALGIDPVTTTELFDAKTRRQAGLGEAETDDTLWKQSNSQAGDVDNAIIEAKHNEITALLDKIDAYRKTAEETGVDFSEQIAKEEAKIAPLLKKIEEFHSKKAKLSNEVDALTTQLIALQKKATETGKDFSKEIADINAKLAIASESLKKFKEENKPKGAKNAVQEQSTGEMDVQSETRNGETLGEGNTESENTSEEDRYYENDKDSGWPEALESRSKSFYDAGELSDEFDGVAVAIGQLEDLGIENTLDFVSEWKTINDTSEDAINGEISTAGGRYTITLNEAKLTSSDHAAETVTHEVAHAFDMAPHGGVYSSQPEMSFGLKDGVITPVGEVARELHNLYLTKQAWNEYLEYPFDTAKFPSIDNHVIVEGEAFAQAFSAYANPKVQEVMRRLAPKTAAFLDEVIKHVKSTKPLQLQTQTTSAKSALAFRNRNASTGNKVVSNTNGLGGRGQERLASQSAAQNVLNSPQVGVIQDSLKATLSTAVNLISFTSDVLNKAISQGLTEARNLTRLYQQRSALMNKLEVQARKIVDLSDAIAPQELPIANAFLRDTTRLGKWGFQPSWIKSNVPIDFAMKMRWKNDLSPEAKVWVTETLRHGHDMLQQKKNFVNEAANLEYDALISAAQADNDLTRVASLQAAKASKVKEYGRLFRVNENTPYAPLKRYGDYVVVAKSKEYEQAEKANDSKRKAELEKDENHYFVDFAEDNANALKMVRELQDSKKYSDVYGRQKEAVRDSMYGGTLGALAKLKTTLAAEIENAHTAGEKAALKKTQDMVMDMFLTSLAENSARKSELGRKGVAGNIDMLRSFATQARADAHFLAASKHNTETNLTLNKMRKQMKGLKSSQQLEASKTFNEIQKRHGDSMEFNQNNWTVGLINRATSIWMLATSPIYYLQNLTQPFMLSLPVMTEHHNYLKAANALGKAYTDVSALFGKEKADGDIDFSKFPADVRKMLETLSDRGRIQISMDAELGRVRIDATGKASQAWNKVDRVIRSASEKIEAINRVTTAMAAYRMELAKTGNVAKAIDYADSIIERTHGDYTSINAPRAFNTNLGKVALQFRKFQLIQGTLLVKMVYNSVKGESAEVRAGARKALAFTLGHTAVMAGAVGMPGFALLSFILSNLGRLWQEPEDEPFDLEQELRKMIGDEDTANLILRGAPNLAGIDLSAKLGMGNVFSIVPYSDVELSRKGFNEIATGLVLGASGAVGAKVFDGLGQIAKGEYYRGLETLMPTGIANGMKAYREQESGATKRNGDITLPADEIDAFDTFATAIGLTTTKKALQSQRTEQKYQTEQHLNEQSDRIRNEFLQAKKNGESTQEAIDKWRALQNKKAEMGFKRQGVDALYKAVQQQRTREKNVIEGIPYNKTNKKYVKELTGFSDGGEVSYEADPVVGNQGSVAPYGTRWITSPSDPVTAKGSGYFGLLPNKVEGGISSELSADNEKGSYPLISPTLTKAELNDILANKPNEEAESKSRAWQKVQMQKGQSPFAEKLGLRAPQPTK